MRNPHLELRAYLKKLIDRFLVIESLFDQLKTMSEWERPNRVEALEIGGYFFSLARYSFDRTILIELSMLLSSKEEKSLVDFLKKAKEHTLTLGPHRYNAVNSRREPVKPEVYRRICDRSLRAIAKHEGAIKRMKARRDKAFAHADSGYFDNTESFLKRYPVDKKEIREVLNTTSDILRTQHLYLMDSDVIMKVQSVRGIDTVLKHVRAFNRVWRDRKLVMEKGVRPFVYKLENYREGFSVADLKKPHPAK